jgi:uncharacterized protein (TIGR00255 family)
MTGFGHGEAATDKISFSIEISSVNRKQFEMRFLAPGELSSLESSARAIVSEYYSRGSIQLRVQFKQNKSDSFASVDSNLLDMMTNCAISARKNAGLPVESVNVEELMRLPGVVSYSLPDTKDAEFVSAFESAVREACEAAQKMRAIEGNALKNDLETRSSKLKELFAELQTLCAKIPENVKKRLNEKLAKEKLPVAPDDPSLLREILFYTDRADVSEEIARLQSHFAQLDIFFASEKPMGRSLDFLAQEFFREITTLGNKAASPEVSPLTVAFKSELEKLREQIQNVE